MKRVAILTRLILFSVLILLAGSLNRNVYAQSKKLQAKQHRLFVKAVTNNSTFDYWTVARIKNLQDNSVKTICVSGNFLHGALLMDGYTESQILNSKDHYFELKSDKALYNISYSEYPVLGFDEVAKEYDFEDRLRILKKKGFLSKKKRFSLLIEIKDDDHVKMAMLAHMFLEKGYLCGENGCWGGTLQAFSDEKGMDN